MAARLSLVFIVVIALAQAAATAAEPATRPARRSIIERLTAEQLARFDRDRAVLAARVRRAEVPYPFVRGTFHMHSELSHDSRGKVAEVIAAARKTGTRIVGFSEHPSKTTDVIAANVKGWRDGVYFLAGTESNNTLFWPGRDGEADLRFVSHVEEVPEFERAGFDGMEIYNTHSDAKDEPIKQLLAALILNLPAVRAHPEAAFCSFLDPPTAFLARLDRLAGDAPFAGLAANDSHQNQGLKVLAVPGGGVEVRDAEDDVIWRADGFKAAVLLRALGHGQTATQPSVVLQFQLDPYEISMRHVGTFLQIEQISEKSVRHALRAGRIIIGFEIVAPLPAFGFWAERDGKAVGTIGDQITAGPGLALRVSLPLEAELQLVRNGQPVLQTRADACTLADPAPGVYRLYAEQTLAGERWPWVISNPIYVKSPAP